MGAADDNGCGLGAPGGTAGFGTRPRHSARRDRGFKHLINSPFVRQQSADNTQGIGNKNLVLRLINRFTVPIPPLAEQRRIVAKVDQLMALVDELNTQLATARRTGADLMEAVVAELTAAA